MTDTVSEISQIAKALCAAQKAMGKALKSSSNPHFKSKYADLASVMDACMGALSDNGICVIQPVGEDEVGRYVETVLLHSSGESLRCRVPLIIAKNDMQGFGSAVTYARRYGLMSMAGIAPEDDDGNAAAQAAPRHSSTEALREAWRDAVMDSLPENATGQQKAEAFANAICAAFSEKKTEKSLASEWDKRASIIAGLRERFPGLHGKVIDAYETRRMEIVGPSEADQIPA